jgi:hypothetical protein
MRLWQSTEDLFDNLLGFAIEAVPIYRPRFFKEVSINADRLIAASFPKSVSHSAGSIVVFKADLVAKVPEVNT